MTHTTEGTTEVVEAVRFNFLTADEVRKNSFVKITSPLLLDGVQRPVPGGLYDPALGSLEDRTPCKTCGQRSFYCPGHCGHIDLVSPVYNPLLFNNLYTLLERTCFFCYHFRGERRKVELCLSKLELISRGDVAGAKNLEAGSATESPLSEDGSIYDGSSSSVLSNSDADSSAGSKQPEAWNSLQLDAAMSVINEFLKDKNKKCGACGAKSQTKITKPTFGWFHMNGISSSTARGNIIGGHEMKGPLAGGDESLEGEDDEDTVLIGQVTDTSEPDSPTVTSSEKSSGRRKGHVGKDDKFVDEFVRQKKFFKGPLLPSEVKEMIKLLWENEARLCSFISDIQQRNSGIGTHYSMFFLDTILVPPIKFRPPTKGGDSVMEHAQTVLLAKVIQANTSLGNSHINQAQRSTIISRWMELQQSVNVLFDGKTGAGQSREVASGICQLLEKKEGLFRQNMMGKRVNYACRSVISPDPYLAVNEIGIPPYFALRLTYPEKVTPWNIADLRKAIVNGPEVHPGATHYVDRVSNSKLPTVRKGRISISRKLPSSRSSSAQPWKNSDNEFEGKVVLRHLRDGDIVLVNRQPTLHKPSIMAHVVRVLKGEKTLRMHYANCSTYNADFDGDEMNVHFPQDEVSRAEAYNIVNANNQYVKPTNGFPIRALIQDHIVSAALLTKRDTFLSFNDFNQLLYSSGVSSSGLGSPGRPGKKVIFTAEDNILYPLPAVLKPEPLWTGKQVITAVLNHLTRGRPPFSVEKQGKVPSDFFKRKVSESSYESRKDKSSKREEVKKAKGQENNLEPGEETVVIFKNYLVAGVIDKAQFGDYGLVHTVQELYGSNTAGTLLSVFSRLFTAYLQTHGFTCGVDDLLLLHDKDVKRKQQLEECEGCGEEVHRDVVGLNKADILDQMDLQLRIEKTIRSNGEAAMTNLDRRMISKLNELSSNKIEKDLLSEGLLKPTGKNCISLMTTSGAKGGNANFQQISSHLGQQELEGKRVPRMVSGKTLPCFAPWDWASRAGGFIIDRFLTGLRPQEYYFHCMAGREGLVDTAVKTSRSGYLQRCLIKNLECLKVSYDHTVRDADGSIVQFYYGEDGVDVHQTSFVTKFDILSTNLDVMKEKCSAEILKGNGYIKRLPKSIKDKAKKFVQDNGSLKAKDFMRAVEYKYFSSLAQPGEPVGVVAAQSVGEPSTQMTLNTFHHAGRGEMNVTLGIPRLQEILMTASAEIKTPIMTCPLWRGTSKEEASALAEKLKKLTVADLIDSMDLAVVPFVVNKGDIYRIYKLKMRLRRHNLASKARCQEVLQVVYRRALEDAIENHMVLLSKITGIKNFVAETSGKASKDGDLEASVDIDQATTNNIDDDNGDDGEDNEDLGFDGQKRKAQSRDDMEYDTDQEEDHIRAEPTSGFESEVDDQAGNGDENLEVVPPSSPEKSDKKKKSSDKKKKTKLTFVAKDYDRSKFVEVNGLDFEIHFHFQNDEPHILLAQIAQKVAKKVYIRSCGQIESCVVVTCKDAQVMYYGEDPKNRQEIKANVKEEIPAIQTNGVDFDAVWQLQDVLDPRYIYSNDINAMLMKYGVEAARETIMREVQHVFRSYGISVDIRHLTLIADFMTQSGGYRPMSRNGGIAESVSPFGKMSFETASKFIVEAAYHGQVDNLDTPSARICLGLPVKMGTGSFDLLQQIDV